MEYQGDKQDLTEGDFPDDSLLSGRVRKGNISSTPIALLPLSNEVGVKNTKNEEVEDVTS